MEYVGSAQIRRQLDRSRHRQPLRLEISRRSVRGRAGAPKFVTQVRVGDREAVVVPWDLKRAAQTVGS
jgi:hypothetical protein